MMCDRCKCELEPEVTHGEKVAAILRAFNAGPQTLAQLALAVHGRDTALNRRKISALIKMSLRGVLEPVDGKGTWRLANAAPVRTSAIEEMMRVFT